jgi:hypothetical protein
MSPLSQALLVRARVNFYSRRVTRFAQARECSPQLSVETFLLPRIQPKFVVGSKSPKTTQGASSSRPFSRTLTFFFFGRTLIVVT